MADLWHRTNTVMVRVARPAPTRSGRPPRGRIHSIYRRDARRTSWGCFCLQSLWRHYIGWARFIRCTHMRWFPAPAVPRRPARTNRFRKVCRCQRLMTKTARSQ